MPARSLWWGAAAVLLWVASLVLAFRWGLHSGEMDSPGVAAVASRESPARSEWPAAGTESLEPEPETFSPEDRPSWQFTSRMDAGRQRVLQCLLKDANDNELSYAERIFGGLDAEGREEAFERLKTIDSIPLCQAAYRVIFSEWAAGEPEAAIRAADVMKGSPGGDAAVVYAWAQFLGDDPVAVRWALDSWPHPGDWSAVMSAIDDAAIAADDYHAYAQVLETLAERDVCEPHELALLAMRLNGERWGTPGEALSLFSRIHEKSGELVDADETRRDFANFMKAHWDDPAAVAEIAALLPSIANVSMRAGMIMGMGKAWLENDPEAALASTDLLPAGLREKVHSELFEQLIGIDQGAAVDYFSQMPTGELRDHLIASSAEGWIEAWGRASLLAQVPRVQSDIVVMKMLNAAVRSMEHHAWDNHVEPAETDPAISQLLAAQNRMPDGSRRRRFVESVYNAWARSGTDEPAVIAARLDEETLLSPTERMELLERITASFESGFQMRERVRKRMESGHDDDELSTIEPLIIDAG